MPLSDSARIVSRNFGLHERMSSGGLRGRGDRGGVEDRIGEILNLGCDI